MSDQAVDTILKDEMRQWLLDCFEEEGDREEIEELTYAQLRRVINKYYDGGLNSFVSAVLDTAQVRW
jgi:hypothetical protein